MTRILAIALTLGLATVLATQSSPNAEAAKRGKKSLQHKASEPRKGMGEVEQGLSVNLFGTSMSKRGPRLKRR
jgi:hypothetical protein